MRNLTFVRVALPLAAIALAWLGATGSCSYTTRECSVLCGSGGACPSGLACAADGYCHSPGTPLCTDVDADPARPDGHAGGPDSAGGADARQGRDGGECVPACLDPQTLEDCSGTIRTCPLGCIVEASVPRCLELVPSNGATQADMDEAFEKLFVPSGATFTLKTDDGSIMDGNGAVVRQGGTGVQQGIDLDIRNGVAFLGVTEVVIERQATLRLWGMMPLVIVARGQATILGTIEVSGGYCSPGNPQPSCAGPGGGQGGSVSAPGLGCGGGGRAAVVAGAPGGGGGGGAFGAPGNTGGAAGAAAGGARGETTNCGLGLDPLFGGSGGGGSNLAAGGGGGGALQITAFAEIVLGSGTDRGVINAGGGGGAGNGGGGGAGGGILLEAPAIAMRFCALGANGGGGGGGGTSGTAGATGRWDGQQAAGGSGSANGGGGGTSSSSALPGGASTSGGGGGGGGVGRIVLRAAQAPAQADLCANTSPYPSLEKVFAQ